MGPQSGAGALWLIGRDSQRDELLQLWADARHGRGGFAVVSGDAGIGKTRLVEHVCAGFVDRAEGACRIAWGACTGVDVPALWPWRSVLSELGAVDLFEDATAPTGSLSDPGADRARAHAAIIDRLRSAASDAPTLVVLDDLHWADPDSIAITRLLAGELRRMSLLLIATMRPDEPASTALELRRTLAEIASSTSMIHLDGLTSESVAELVARISGREPTPELTATVVDRTGGNPLFVRELVRMMLAEGTIDGVDDHDVRLPPLVRDVLLRRSAQLPQHVRRLLDAAAVAGREIAVVTLADAVGEPHDAVLDSLAPARSEKLVQIQDGNLRFEHDLVREALADDLDDAHRRHLHAAVGDALGRHGGPGSGRSEIAGHLVAAVPVVDPVDAAVAALRAGEESIAQHAPADAVAQLRRGLAVLGDGATATHLALQLALGDALAAVGDRPASDAAYDRATNAARALGDADGLARAALGGAGKMARPRSDPNTVTRLEEALEARGDRRDATTARVMARLSHALLFSGDLARRNRLADDAVELARTTGDLDALASALYAWILVHQSSTNFDARLARAEELVTVGRASGVDQAEAAALHLHAHQMAEAGDMPTFDADVAAYGALANRSANATWRWTALVHRAMRATMQGNFTEGERLGEAAFELGARSQHDVAGAVFGSHLMVLRTWQGRLDEMLPVVVKFAGQYRELPAAMASVPYIRAEIGALDEARDNLHHLRSDLAVEDLPGAHSWTVAVAMIARAAQLTGAADLAARLQAPLATFAERNVIGPFGDCYYGPAILYVGLCSATAGELDRAIGELEQAISSAKSVGSRPVAAWATAELATLHRTRGELAEAESRRQEASAELRRLGMVRHLARLDAAWSDEPVDGASVSAFRPGPNGWHITFAGRTVQVRNSKGICDLHRLVSTPDTDLHVLELVQADGAPRAAPGGPQPMLDARAKDEYRRRLQQLDAEIDEADDYADLARAERARAERDALIDQLRAAVGLGGRDRAIPDDAERARQAVRARIRYALDQIEPLHPELHRHLERSVTTGLFCSYRPERPTTWST